MFIHIISYGFLWPWYSIICYIL